QHLRPRRRGRRGYRGCFFEDDVGVGATHTEGADPGAQYAVPFPRAVFAADLERSAVEVQFGVRAGVVQGRRYRPMFEAQNRLDQAGYTGGGFKVADVRLDRSDVARAGASFLGNLESLAQTFDFNRITQRSAGSVRLDV